MARIFDLRAVYQESYYLVTVFDYRNYDRTFETKNESAVKNFYSEDPSLQKKGYKELMKEFQSSNTKTKICNE